MNRKKHFLLILIALVLICSLSFSLIACNRDNANKPNEEEKDNALVANGTFAGVETETYPKSPSSWTASAGSTSGSQATPAGKDDVISGVISVEKKAFRDNAKKWQLDKNIPVTKVDDSKDDNVLMINNVIADGSSYRYSSSPITIDKDGYYKVTVNVRTDATAKAYIHVLGDAYGEFININTNNAWQQVELYIEGATNSNKSISISVSNGWGDKINGTMSHGAVFFDSIKVEKLEKKDDANYGKNIYDAKAKANTSSDNFSVYSMQMPDAEFDYTTGSTNPFSPAKFRGYTGYSDNSSENAPSGSTYVSHGVVDTSLDHKVLGLENVTPAPNTIGNKILFINNKMRTAYGYRSSVPFVIKAGEVYNFSVQIRTQNMLPGNGATLRFIESSTDNSNKWVKANIDTHKNGVDEWQTITATIKGNQLKDMEIYFELWLGQGGKTEDTKWTTGTVYMDDIKFSKVDAAAPALAGETTSDITVDLTEKIDRTNNLVKNGEFDGFIMQDGTTNGWAEMTEENNKTYNFNNKGIAEHKVYSNIDGKPVVLPSNPKFPIKVSKDGSPDVDLTSALKISIKEKTAYGIVINTDGHDFNIEKNHYYKFSMWVKTDLDEKYDSNGLNIRLMQRIDEEDKDDKVIASYENVNTRKVEANNGYIQVVFFVEGSDLKDSKLYVDVMLGSGSRFTPDTHVVGDAYITLVGLEEISHNDYTKASTSTYVKKNSLMVTKGSNGKITNAGFNNYDINATYDNYTKHQGELGEGVTEDDILKEIFDDKGSFKVPTAPVGWSITNKTYLEALTTGIVSNETQFENLIAKNSAFDIPSIPDMAKKYEKFLDNDNHKGASDGVLVIATKGAKENADGVLTVPTPPEVCGCTCEACKKNGFCDGTKCTDPNCKCLHKTKIGVRPVGYTSSNLSLNADTRYIISVRVKALEGMATVVLNNNKQSTSVVVDSASTQSWQTVNFYVNTGLNPATVKLELYLGNKEDGVENIIKGAVAFEDATMYAVDDEKEFNNLIANMDKYSKKATYITDSFNVETPNEDGLTAVNSNWQGSSGNGSTDAADLVKGIFDKNTTRREWLHTTKTDDNKKVTDTYIDNNVFEYLQLNSDDNFLVINNVTPNAYSFKNTNPDMKFSNKTNDGYYEVSVDVLTYGLQESDSAYIDLKLRNATYSFNNDNKYKVNTSTYKDGKETLGKWTNYKFVVKTPKDVEISDISITLGLGKKTDDDKDKDKFFVQGYAFFDNVTFKEIDQATFDKDIAESDKATIQKVTATKEEIITPEKEEEPEKVKPNFDLLWVYITSAVIGVVIIVVVIVILVKKYQKKANNKAAKNRAPKSTFDRSNVENNEAAGKQSANKDEFKD